MKIVQLEKPAWDVIVNYVQTNSCFKSVTGIQYQARVSGTVIYYQGGNRNGGEEETITMDDFNKAFKSIQSFTNINTNSIKTTIPNSIYRKRTPFIGLLYSSGIIQ